jgi:hypothetical protein
MSLPPDPSPLGPADYAELGAAGRRLAGVAGALATLVVLGAGAVAATLAGAVPRPVPAVLGLGVLGLLGQLVPRLRRWRAVREDARGGRAEVRNEPVSVELAIGLGLLGVQHPLLRTRNEAFDLARPLAASLESGVTYRLRIAPRSRVLLGVEAIDKPFLRGSGSSAFMLD